MGLFNQRGQLSRSELEMVARMVAEQLQQPFSSAALSPGVDALQPGTPLPRDFLAQLTSGFLGGSGGDGYNFGEVDEATLAFVPGGRGESGELCYEATGNQLVPQGAIVRVWHGETGYLFQVFASAQGGGGTNVGGSGAAFSGCRVYRSTNLSGLSYNANNRIAFDTEAYDTGSYHDNVTNPSRLNLPGPGFYAIGGRVPHFFSDANQAVIQTVSIWLNGLATELARTSLVLNTSGVGGPFLGSNVIEVYTEYYSPTGGDYVELISYANNLTGSGTYAVLGATWADFRAHLIGRAAS